MQNIKNLLHRRFITDQQAVVAARFARRPNEFTLAPSLFRVLHDLIVKDIPLEEYEKQRGWPARSAKLMLGQLLFALQEVEGLFWSGDANISREHMIEQIEYLTGDDHQKIFDAMARYGLTKMEARLFVILHNEARPLTKDTLMRRLYAGLPEADVPTSNVIESFLCYMRKKLRRDWVIASVFGAGIELRAVPQVNDAAPIPEGDLGVKS